MRALLIGACAIALAAPAAAQQQKPDSTKAPPAQTSLFTSEQATRGSSVYAKVCVECHERLEYTGSEFRAKWNNRPAFELFDLLRSTMPDENPGSLSAQEYADVLAYMMQLNKVAPGKVELPKDDAALKKLKLVIPK